MGPRLLHFAAVMLTGLALVPAGAHLFSLPSKMTLTMDQYFTVQAIYRGWAMFGAVIVAAVIANAFLAGVLLHQRRPCALNAAASALLIVALLFFFALVQPANLATENWTVIPPNWVELRMHWEYGHALGAILTFLAFAAAVLSAVRQSGGAAEFDGAPVERDDGDRGRVRFDVPLRAALLGRRP